jgi:hypothetical protein
MILAMDARERIDSRPRDSPKPTSHSRAAPRNGFVRQPAFKEASVSIEVQCPNPDCARVHRVKNRWAGKRGTCPDCGAVIEVPGTRAPVPRHEPEPFPEPEPEPVAAEAAEEVATVSNEVVDVGDETVAFEQPSVQEEKAEEEAAVVAAEAVIDDPFAVLEEGDSAPAHSADDDLFVTEVLEDAEDAEVAVSEEAEEVVDVGDETVAFEPPPPPAKEKKPGKKNR